MKRFVSGVFVDGGTPATVSVDASSAEIALGSQRLGLRLYDTAGQERFAPLTKPYYRQADGVIIVYDVGSVRSFESALSYWVAQVGPCMCMHGYV